MDGTDIQLYHRCYRLPLMWGVPYPVARVWLPLAFILSEKSIFDFNSFREI